MCGHRPSLGYAICPRRQVKHAFFTVVSLLSPVYHTSCCVGADIPLATILAKPEEWVRENETIVFVCRQGNDSQVAASAVRQVGRGLGATASVKDVIGGLVGWHDYVDESFPVY